MVAIRVMQVALDKVIDVIAVRNGRMPASGTVFMSAIVGATIMLWRAPSRVFRSDLERVLVNVIAMQVM